MVIREAGFCINIYYCGCANVEIAFDSIKWLKLRAFYKLIISVAPHLKSIKVTVCVRQNDIFPVHPKVIVSITRNLKCKK